MSISFCWTALERILHRHECSYWCQEKKRTRFLFPGPPSSPFFKCKLSPFSAPQKGGGGGPGGGGGGGQMGRRRARSGDQNVFAQALVESRPRAI